MKHKLVHKAAALLLALLLVLSGCGSAERPEDQQGPAFPESEKPQVGGGEESDAQDMPSRVAVNERFTLRISGDDSFNPLTCKSVYNESIMSLVYESLFCLDASLEPSPLLCDTCTTEDGITYTLTLIDAKMHDGSDLKPVDVVYSINQARMGSKYSARLENIQECYDNGLGGIVIVLKNRDYSLPALLDIPIICAGSMLEDYPAGTGPYVLKKSGRNLVLRSFSSYRSYEAIPLSIIYLTEIEDDEVEQSFSNQNLDLLWYDPAGTVHLNMYGEYETRRYDTSILQYIGFNYTNTALNDIRVRRAISYAVDREGIVAETYGGMARAAYSIFNSGWYLYDDSWEVEEDGSLAAMAAQLAEAGLQDFNHDGYLEYPAGTSYFEENLRFLVYKGSEKKVETATAIAETLGRVGLRVTVKALDWEEYLYTLRDGNYDLYYGEAALTHNLDLSPLLSPGGSLRYGGTGGADYGKLITAAAEAPDDQTRLVYLGGISAKVSEELPLIPILYRQYVVYTHRGEVNGLHPSVTGLFQSVTEWSIHLM